MRSIEKLESAAQLLLKSKSTIAFTGAGISVESGIPTFRGIGGIWNNYSPRLLDINYFYRFPEKTWPVIIELFYDFFEDKTPNQAHLTLSAWESRHMLDGIITQNIDHLHQSAGSKKVYDFHGNAHFLICRKCGWKGEKTSEILAQIPPECCRCGALLKPDFVFFGENIAPDVYEMSVEAVAKCDVLLIIGTSGEVSPANQLPHLAKQNGAKIIEVNPETSFFSQSITDIFLQGKATECLLELNKLLHLNHQK